MIAGIDVGGTKTLIAVFKADGEIVEKDKFPTPKKYKDFISVLAENIHSLKTKTIDKTVIAIPGKVDRQRGVGHAFGNLLWKDVPIENDVIKITSSKVLVENDANLAGLSEAHLIPDYHKVLYLTVSTGIGSVLVVDGEMDPDTLDSEVGQDIFEYEGKIQRWEDFASGKAIVQRYGKRASDIEDAKIWEEISANIAIGLYNTIATLTPDAVVIGGGVGAHLEKFKEPLRAALNKYTDPLVKIPPILKAKRAEEAVIYGCFILSKKIKS